MGEKREERENGNVNCNTTEQPSKNQSLRLKIIDCWHNVIIFSHQSLKKVSRKKVGEVKTHEMYVTLVRLSTL